MSRYTLNIGLANPFTGDNNTVDYTLIEALFHIGGIDQISVQQSETERTVVIDFNKVTGSIFKLAIALDQDCIALYDNKLHTGTLIGEKADQWGEFNLAFFLFNKETV